MTMRRVLVRLLLALTVLLLAALAAWALTGAARQLPRVQTAGQALETGVQLALGLLSVVLAVRAAVRRSPVRAVRRCHPRAI